MHQLKDITLTEIKSIPTDLVDIVPIVREYVNNVKNSYVQRCEAVKYRNEVIGRVLDSDKIGPVLFDFYYGNMVEEDCSGDDPNLYLYAMGKMKHNKQVDS